MKSFFERRKDSLICFAFVQSKKGGKMPKRAKTRVEKQLFKTAFKSRKIDTVFWNSSRKCKKKNTRKQMRKPYLSKKSFTYEIYA